MYFPPKNWMGGKAKKAETSLKPTLKGLRSSSCKCEWACNLKSVSRCWHKGCKIYGRKDEEELGFEFFKDISEFSGGFLKAFFCWDNMNYWRMENYCLVKKEKMGPKKKEGEKKECQAFIITCINQLDLLVPFQWTSPRFPGCKILARLLLQTRDAWFF